MVMRNGTYVLSILNACSRVISADYLEFCQRLLLLAVLILYTLVWNVASEDACFKKDFCTLSCMWKPHYFIKLAHSGNCETLHGALHV